MSQSIPLYLHIGFHKTGTTALQGFFYPNRKLLLERGFLYPTVEMSPNGQQAYPYAINEVPMKRFNGPPDKVALRAQFLAAVEAANPKQVLISSENFGGAREATMIQGCKEFFVGFQVKIVVYLRRQDDYFCSVYQQRVKPPHQFKGRIADLDIAWEMDYWQRLLPWAQAFGAENLIVRPYERAQFPQGDIFADFMQLLGLTTAGCDIPKKEFNISLNPRQTEMLRLCNQFDIPQKDKFVEFLRANFWIKRDVLHINQPAFLFCRRIRKILVWPLLKRCILVCR